MCCAMVQWVEITSSPRWATCPILIIVVWSEDFLKKSLTYWVTCVETWMAHDGTIWYIKTSHVPSCQCYNMLQHVTKYSNILQHDETCHHLCNHLLNTRGIHDGIWPRQSFKLALAVSDSIQRVNHTYTYANPSLHFLGPYHTMPYHTLNFLEIVIHSKSYKRHLK